MSEWNYIIAAYVVTWVGILGYALHLAGRVRRAANTLERVEGAAGRASEQETSR